MSWKAKACAISVIGLSESHIRRLLQSGTQVEWAFTMRVAFVEDTIRFSIPLGITGIAAMLRQGGHKVSLFVAERNFNRTIDRLTAFRPDAITFSVLSGSHLGCLAIARRIKERLGTPTLWGGPHPTFFPEMIELPWVDAVCIGEGEEAALEFADRFDAEGGRLPVDVPNFWIKRDGQIFRNPVRERNRHLDDLPWPARDLYYDQFPILRNHGFKHFMAHRGCPYRCTYCFNDTYNRIYRDQARDFKIFTSRTPDSIVDEILWLQKEVPLKIAAFVDDVFTLNRKWTIQFAEVYARRCRLPFSMNARFDNVDPELVAALADAGLRIVYAGIESGDEFIRNTVMKRQMSEEAIVDAATLYRRHGVRVLTENVLGVPEETFASALQTLRLNIRVRPRFANASIFTPYPGLPMTRYAIERGYFDGDFDRLNHNYYHGSPMRFPVEADRKRILNLRCFFSLLVNHPWLLRLVRPLLNTPPNPVFRWLGDILDGYLLKRCLPYRFTPREFLVTVWHYLTRYRQGSNAARTAEAKRPVLRTGVGTYLDSIP